MYSIKKVINNNVVLVIDSKLREFIVAGKGVGFQKKIDDIIEEESIEKKYSLMPGDTDKLLDYIIDFDYKLFSVCDDIKCLVEKYSDTEYTNYMFFSLIDHINEAVKRVRNNIIVPNEIGDEELSFYKLEFGLSREAGKIIEDQLGVKFSTSELNMLALHFITCLQGADYSRINEKVIKITNEIIDIIRYKNLNELDDDFHMKRFIVHLKYFIIRQLNENETQSSYNDDLYRLLISQYESSYETLSAIIEYLEESYDFLIEPNERMYLLIHLVRIIK